MDPENRGDGRDRGVSARQSRYVFTHRSELQLPIREEYEVISFRHARPRRHRGCGAPSHDPASHGGDPSERDPTPDRQHFSMTSQPIVCSVLFRLFRTHSLSSLPAYHGSLWRYQVFPPCEIPSLPDLPVALWGLSL